MGDEQSLLRFSRQQPGILEHLYQTPLDAGQWPRFLESLVAASSARSARLLVMDRQAQEVQYSAKVHIDDDQHRDYVRYYVNRCPWRPELALKAPGRLYNTHTDFSCDQQQFYRTEFFNDWARHLDIEHGLCGSVYNDSRFTVQLLVQRTADQGPFPRRLTHQINQLIPHVRQVLQLSRAMTLQREQHLTALAAAERSFMPFLLSDDQGAVPYICPRAQALLERLPGIWLSQGRLQFQCARQHLWFRKALAKVVIGPLHEQQTLVLTPPQRSVPIRLMITGMTPETGGPDIWPNGVAAAVYIQDPEMHLDVDEGVLSRLFALTEAEARVAAAVALGDDPRQLAERCGVSLHTVRTQLKSAMRKTGTCRQTGLARLVISSAAVRDRSFSSTLL